MKKINNLISPILAKIPSSKNWIFWLVLALLIKSCFFLYKVSIENHPVHNEIYTETFAFEGGDDASYIEPIENLIKNGHYYCEKYEDYRMPGYGSIFFMLRIFLPQTLSLNILVVLQLILSIISVYILAIIAYLIFKKQRYFYLTFALYLISTYVSLFDNIILTESFTASSFIFSLYFILQTQKAKYYLFLSGLFLTWCIFLRPVMAPLLLIFIIYIIRSDSNKLFSFTNYKWKSVLIFLVPFLIIDGAWVSRNYVHYKKIIPLTKSVYYPGVEETALGSLFRFMNAFGGSIVWWQPGSNISFFIQTDANKKYKNIISLPSNIYTSKFNYDSLLVLKKSYCDLQDSKLSIYKKKKTEQEVISKFNTYTKSIKDEKPFLFYISSRFRVLKTYFIHSGTYNLFFQTSSELTKMKWIVKVFYSLLYFIIIIGGGLGCLYLLFKSLSNINYFLISTSGLYVALVNPLILKMDHFRYFVPGYPIFLLACIYILSEIFTNIINKYHNA